VIAGAPSGWGSDSATHEKVIGGEMILRDGAVSYVHVPAPSTRILSLLNKETIRAGLGS